MTTAHIHIPTVPIEAATPAPGEERHWIGEAWCLICHKLFKWSLRVFSPPPSDRTVHGKAAW